MCAWPCAATVEPVVRHHVVSVPQRTPEHGRGAGSSVGVEPRGSSCSRMALVAPARQHDGKVRAGIKSERSRRPLGASRSGWDGATRTPRGRGRCPRTVARSQAGEDRTTTPRWRARTRTVLSRRERRVSPFGKKNGKSTTWEPRTLRRSVGSRPTRGQRSACTSSPRRPRTARWKGAG